MFMQSDMNGKGEEFSRPVESIMKCEDFKSNFARRLSNRYISKAPVPRQDISLKLLPTTDPQNNAPERIEPTQLSKSVEPKAGHSPNKTDIHLGNTEVSALNMEVETLRWQLSQTEANRQMHIALLKQIVSFLSRVKEHIGCQKPELGVRKETMSARLVPRSFNVGELPRSRSVIHVNKSSEYCLTPTKKITTRKISKSISNVNGFRDCNGTWSSKISLASDTESSQKLSEEMSRLITLANTVLSTKLPDLTCISANLEKSIEKHDIICQPTNLTFSLNHIEEDTPPLVHNSSNAGTCQLVESVVKAKDSNQGFILSSSRITSELENDFAELKIEKENSITTPKSTLTTHRTVDKRNDYNTANFIEDESGFSSMNSFQEIGIPIISIIPPSPSKDVDYIDGITDLLHDNTKWKANSLDLDKQAVKVFWV